MARGVFFKDPDAVLDYAIDWSQWLDDDTITTSTWGADEGIGIDSDDMDTTRTSVWLSGGTAGTTYTVTNHITTAAGREDNRSIVIRCMEK